MPCSSLRTCRVFVACLMIVLVVPGTARAQGDFDRALQEAVQRFEKEMDYERAWEQLQRARRLARGTTQELAVYLHEGIFLGEMNRLEDARESFKKALELDREAKLPLSVAPKVAKLFETARAEVLASGPKPPPGRWGDEPVRPQLLPEEGKGSASVDLTERVHQRSRVPVASLMLCGAGAVAAGMGVIIGLQARSKAADANMAYEDGYPPASELSRLSAFVDDAQSEARTANVMFGTAALAVGGAIVTWLLTRDDSGTAPQGEP